MNSNNSLELQSGRIVRLLRETGVRFALIGGIAVSYHSVERTTKDIDLAVAVESDAEAESLVRTLTRRGYRIATVIEQDEADRLSTVRLVSQVDDEILVDLLFASSGIESEIVSGAEEIEVFPNVFMPVGNRASLIALKVLSANLKTRLKDILDLQNLLDRANPEEIDIARNLLSLITERGYNRNKDLQKDLDGYIEQFKG